jgi:Flp pilus assembly protein TadD
MTMHTSFRRIAMSCASVALLACTSAPAYQPSPSDAEESYRIGRNFHLAMRPEQALFYYRSALRFYPFHVNARNGLAVLYAEQGQLDLAIAMWQEMAVTATGQSRAALLGNLGYAHLLQGDAARAQAVLEQACLLDPLNEGAWQHLGDALASAGQLERAQAMHRQAASLRGHDLRADYAQTKAAPVSTWAQTEIRENSSGIFELRRIEALAAQPHAAGAPAMLEISNGNGVRGMAKSLARQLGEGDTRVVRLTNQKGYAVHRTRVEYQPNYRRAAEQLAQRVGASNVVAAARPGRSDLRLVLGHDLKRAPATLVAAR